MSNKNSQNQSHAPVLFLNDVGVVYPGDVTALHPVTCQFEAGKLTVLLGSSGAGKSTLLRCLNLLVAPSSGEVRHPRLGAVRRGAPLRAHRREIGMVFQQHQLIKRLPALDNVLMGRLGYHGILRSLWPLPRVDRRLALECLDRVGLAEKALRRVSQLSGGEQQRVGIARALCQQPRVLLADEPVASLDPGTARRLLNLLESICREDGLAVILSLHQVDLAREYADRIIGLRHGRVLLDDAPGNIGEEQLAALYGQAEAPAREREPAKPVAPKELAPA